MRPTARWNKTPPIAPQKAPIPTTDATAERGNMSLASVYTFAHHAWCAAAATATMSTAVRTLDANGASAVGTRNDEERHREHRGLARARNRVHCGGNRIQMHSAVRRAAALSASLDLPFFVASESA